MRAPTRKNRGYSLIELLVVMAIIGVLSLITVPSFVSFQRAGKMKTALRNFTMDVRGLRQKAITQNVWARVTITPAATETAASRTYTFTQSSDNGTTWTALSMRGGYGGVTNKVIGQGGGNIKELEKAVYFSSTTFPGGQIIFRPDGTVNVPAGSTSASVVLRTKWNVTKNLITVTITPSGQLRTVATHV
jgi:type IV fimbrial biogenesis protein FimT